MAKLYEVIALVGQQTPSTLLRMPPPAPLSAELTLLCSSPPLKRTVSQTYEYIVAARAAHDVSWCQVLFSELVAAKP